MNVWKQRLAPFVRPVVRPPVRAYFRHAPTNHGKAALWRLAAHTQWLEHECVVTTRFGARMRVDSRDAIGRYIAYFGVWEPHLTALIEQTLEPGDVFVDVGANVGYFSLLASTLVGDAGAVVAIEAAPRTAAVLAENVRGHPNVRVIEAAASDTSGRADLLCRRPRHGTRDLGSRVGRTLALRGVEKVPVAAATLTEMLTADELERTRIVKIDVEGAETAVLRGLLPGDRPSPRRRADRLRGHAGAR